MHERRPHSNAKLPDADDPAALTAWVDGIESESSRIQARQRLVMAAYEANHHVTMLRIKPLTGWATPADRHRAWAVIIVGLVMSFLSSASLAYLGPDDATALAIFPILWLLWVFVAGHEVARRMRLRSRARLERDQEIAEADAMYAAAAALLEEHEAEHPPTI